MCVRTHASIRMRVYAYACAYACVSSFRQVICEIFNTRSVERIIRRFTPMLDKFHPQPRLRASRPPLVHSRAILDFLSNLFLTLRAFELIFYPHACEIFPCVRIALAYACVYSHARNIYTSEPPVDHEKS